MKTPKFQLTVRAVAALAIALTGSFYAVPALAEDGPSGPATVSPAPSANDSQAATTPAQASAAPLSPTESAAAPQRGISDAGLAQAIRRDLGMTLQQFNAAGAVARRAADAAPSLRTLPGYVGISLSTGKIVVEGRGARLLARVAELNHSGPATFVLAAPAGAAVVPSAAELLASSTQQLFEAYVREVGAAGLQAVTYTDGHFVIRTGGTNTAQTLFTSGGPVPASGGDMVSGLAPQAAAPDTKPKMSAADFVARYANVALEQGSPIATEQDFFGGQGYVIDGRTVCSAGFGAFSPTGQPLVLTAGHCAADGTAKHALIEDPAGAPAAGGSGSGATSGILGTFGFSQFGGPGNSKVGPNGTNVGTDIAILRGIRNGLNLQPAVTRWDNPTDPGQTSVKIVGTVAPFQGQPVCRSGRTLGWSCGTVDEVGTWVIGGPNSLPPNFDNDLRALNGFDSSTVKSRPGDSGGPWISGNFAVGMHTGAESEGGLQTRAIATTLEDAAGKVPGGVQLQLFLTKPTLTTAANGTVTAGKPITGHVGPGPASVVAAHSKVRITIGAQKLEVPVDASGNWQFPAPSSAGQFKFTAETVNGFSRSGAVFYSEVVSEPASDGTRAQPAAWPPAAKPPAAQPRVAEPPVVQPRVAELPAVQQSVAQPSVAEPPAAQAEGSQVQPSSPAQGHVVPPSDTSVTVSGSRPDGTSSANSGQLADSLAAGVLPAAGLGAGALLLCAAFVAFGRRRGR